MLMGRRCDRFRQSVSVLRGENRAALEVARRTSVALDLTARYDQYGMSEQALWDRVYEMDDWWRESTWWAVIFRVACPIAAIFD